VTPGSGGAAGWSATTLLETVDTESVSDASSNSARVAFDSQGNGFAVWVQGYRIYASRYESGSWSPREMIQAISGTAVEPEISVSANGHAVVTWSQYAGSVGNYVWANRYIPGSGWQGVEAVDNAVYQYSRDMLASVNDSGDISIVWTARTGDGTSNYHVHVNRYEAANGGWQGVDQLPELGTGSSTLPQVMLDNAGNTTVVWLQYGAGTSIYDVFTNRYENGGWTGTSVLHDASGSADRAYYPQIAFDDQGNGFAVWTEGSSNNVVAKRFENGQWGAKELIETASGTALNPILRVNASGNAVVAWVQGNSVYANRYDQANGGWQGHELLENDTRAASYVSADISDNGIIQVAWQQQDATTYQYNTFTNRYDPANGGWQGREAVAELSVNTGRNTQVSMDGMGNATLVWEKYDENSIPSLYSARYGSAGGGAPYYEVQAGDTWESIATTLYGTAVVADELVQALYGPSATPANTPLTVGEQLTGLPDPLGDVRLEQVNVTPYYEVQQQDVVGNVWDNLAQLL